MNKRRPLEKRGSSFLSKLRPLPIQRRLDSTHDEASHAEEDVKGAKEPEFPTGLDPKHVLPPVSRPGLIRRESTRLQSFFKSFKMGPHEGRDMDESGSHRFPGDKAPKKSSRNSSHIQRSHSFNHHPQPESGEVGLNPMPDHGIDASLSKSKGSNASLNSSTYYSIELKKPPPHHSTSLLGPGQIKFPTVDRTSREHVQQQQRQQKQQQPTDFSISSPLPHESLNHPAEDFKSTNQQHPSGALSVGSHHPLHHYPGPSYSAFSPPPPSSRASSSAYDFAPDLCHPSNLQGRQPLGESPLGQGKPALQHHHPKGGEPSHPPITQQPVSALEDHNQAMPIVGHSSDHVLIGEAYQLPIQRATANLGHSQSAQSVPSLFHGNQDIHNISFKGPLPPPNRRLTKTSSFCHGSRASHEEQRVLAQARRSLGHLQQPLDRVSEDPPPSLSQGPNQLRRCPNAAHKRRPLVRRSASNVSDAYFSSPFQRGNELPLVNREKMHIYSQPHLNPPESRTSAFPGQGNESSGTHGPPSSRSSQSPYAVSRTTSLCHAESYHSLQTYQQNVLRRQDVLQRQIYMRTYESQSQVNGYGTLPSRRSAFKPPVPRARPNELEEYARQYEDLYMKRMWNTRTGPAHESSASGSHSEYQNLLELHNKPTGRTFQSETTLDIQRSSTLPRPPKPIRGPKKSSFESTRKFFNYLDAHKTQDSKAGYSTMSLPRKMPVKKLVSQFNSQIESQNQSATPVPIYGTLTRRHKVVDPSASERRRSFQLPANIGTLNESHFDRKLSMDEVGRRHHRHLPRNLEEERRSVERILQDWKAQVQESKGEPDYVNLEELSKLSPFIGHAEIVSGFEPSMESLDSWRIQQEAERERSVTGQSRGPPARPPKKAHLRGQPNFPRKPPAPDPSPSPSPPAIPLREGLLEHSSPTFYAPGHLLNSTPPPPTPPKSSRVMQKAMGLSGHGHDDVGLPLPDPTRTYHKDSYMANRRGETLGQEGRYRRTTSSPPTAAKNGFYPSPPSIQEIHQNLLFANHSPQIGSEIANHNLSPANTSDAAVWDNARPPPPEFLSQSSSSSGASTVILTSDTLKKMRRVERSQYQSAPKRPPEVAPKPKLSLSRMSQYSTSNLDSIEDSARHGLLPLQSAKSTPSLHNILPMVNIIELEGGARWKNSLDSLDTVSTVSSSSPRYSGPENPSGAHASSDHAGQVSSTSSSPQQSQSNPQPPTSVHVHSHSDSGLSSLSGRTSTMSPVSTLSTVSSVSTGSSHAGSSRASLRSASIVSSTTTESTNSPPESLITRTEDVESHRGSPASGDSGTGTLRKGSRKKFQEEIDCEELSRELADTLAMSDELQNLLIPSPHEKTLADYVEGILELDLEDGRGQPQRRVSRKNLSPSLLRQRIEALQETDNRSPKSVSTNGNLILNSSQHNNTMKLPKKGNNFNHHANSNHHNNNNILNNNNNRINHHQNGTKSPASLIHNGEDLQRKKEELLRRISQKLDVLRAEQLSLKEEMALNEELGLQVSHLVHNLAKPNECVKFNLHVEEIDKITSLLLGLSGRLARTENSLATLPASNLDEKKSLEAKRKKLAEQLDEAKRLKENIDRRSATVSSFLHRYLNEEQYADYDHFVKMKAKLIMDSREIGDKIKLGEEQIKALQESLYLNTSSPPTSPGQNGSLSTSTPTKAVPPAHRG